MYVCICTGVTDSQIRRAAADGCTDLHELTMRTGAGSNCGSCLTQAAEILAETHAAAAVKLLPLQILRAA